MDDEEMSRDIFFDENEKCDLCGKDGAFDFMGDFICEDCLKKVPKDEDGYFIDKEIEAKEWTGRKN